MAQRMVHLVFQGSCDDEEPVEESIPANPSPNSGGSSLITSPATDGSASLLMPTQPEVALERVEPIDAAAVNSTNSLEAGRCALSDFLDNK